MNKPKVDEVNFYYEQLENEDWGLKPCPFCGNKDIDHGMIHPQFAGKPDMDYWCAWYVNCSECGAEFEFGRSPNQTWEETREEVIEAWNRRTGSDS